MLEVEIFSQQVLCDEAAAREAVGIEPSISTST